MTVRAISSKNPVPSTPQPPDLIPAECRFSIPVPDATLLNIESGFWIPPKKMQCSRVIISATTAGSTSTTIKFMKNSEVGIDLLSSVQLALSSSQKKATFPARGMILDPDIDDHASIMPTAFGTGVKNMVIQVFGVWV